MEKYGYDFRLISWDFPRRNGRRSKYAVSGRRGHKKNKQMNRKIYLRY